jgi:hypothetical protein
MSDHRDQDLHRAFDALNRDTQSSVPSFADLTSPGALNSARRRHRRHRGAAVLVAVSILSIIVLSTRQSDLPDFERFTALTGLDPGEVTWEAPSDFLLALPWQELLRTIPLTDIVTPALRGDSTRPADSSITPRRSS